MKMVRLGFITGKVYKDNEKPAEEYCRVIPEEATEDLSYLDILKNILKTKYENRNGCPMKKQISK